MVRSLSALRSEGAITACAVVCGLLAAPAPSGAARVTPLRVPGARNGHVPRVAVDRDGSAVLVWNRGSGEADRPAGGVFRLPSASELPTFPVLAITFLARGKLAALEDHRVQDYRDECCDYINVATRATGRRFASPYQVARYDSFRGRVDLASNGEGRAAFGLGGDALTVGALNAAGRFASRNPNFSPLFGPPAAAVSPAGTIVVGWQEHVDSVIDRRAPLARVVLTSSRPGTRLRPVAVPGSVVPGVPGETAVASYGAGQALFAWAPRTRSGPARLRVATVSLTRLHAHPHILSPAGSGARAPVARSDGRGGAAVGWQSWHRRRGRVVVYLRRRGASRGRMLALSGPGRRLEGPVVSGDRHGRLLVAWVKDGVVHLAVGTIADGLRARFSLESSHQRATAVTVDRSASALTVNTEPAREAILAWHDSGGIEAASVKLSG